MSKLNIQQLPSDFGYLDCFEAQPGHSLVYTDFTALEPHVCTEFSQDKRMLSLYGPKAKLNDIYLYFGAYTALFGKQIREYYDPDNPTPETMAAAKDALGEIRKVLKVVVLGCNYGMGAKKLQEGVNLAGFKLSFTDARGIHRDYWNFFKGIKDFEAYLLQELDRNDGYIVNGRGRILCIPPDYSKDIVNRFVQSTGHDILIHYLLLLDRKRKANRIPMRPWLVDEHDATVWEVPDSRAEEAKQALLGTYDELNAILKWDIKFKGKVKIGKTLGVKCD